MEIVSNMLDSQYKSYSVYQQDAWVYKNFDPIFGFPNICRFSH